MIFKLDCLTEVRNKEGSLKISQHFYIHNLVEEKSFFLKKIHLIVVMLKFNDGDDLSPNILDTSICNT